MKIGFGSDHAAVELKNSLKEYMQEKGYECVDYGAYSPEEKMDYPIAGRKVAEAIKAGEVDKGVLVCGTGVGISLAANKVPGIRAGVCSDSYTEKAVRSEPIDMRKKARGNLKISAGLWLKGVGYSRYNRLLRRFEFLRFFLNYMVVSG